MNRLTRRQFLAAAAGDPVQQLDTSGADHVRGTPVWENGAVSYIATQSEYLP